jgi:hypothetical protein
MIKVLFLGLVVMYYMPPIEHEEFVYEEVPYTMLVSKPITLRVPVSFSQFFTHVRPRDTSGFATLRYLPTSAKWNPAHVFGMC